MVLEIKFITFIAHIKPNNCFYVVPISAPENMNTIIFPCYPNYAL